VRWIGAGPGAWLLACLLVPQAALGWDDSRLTAPLVIDERQIPYPEFAIYLLPGKTFRLAYEDPGQRGTVRYRGSATDVGRSPLAAADAPGIARLEVENRLTGEVAIIHVVTLVPAARVDKDSRLNGYRVGRYPQQPLRGLEIYRPPAGFVEVTAANRDLRISPNFRLGQFVSKQSSGYPKYLVLRANLLLKLEKILAALNRSGRPTRELVIMSGYRTPWYNAAIGNVAYSRHLWGGAADIYLDDTPADGRMDDLNGDGKIDRADARWLAAFVDDLAASGEFGARIGGIGVYGGTAAHGPFIHVDVRGYRARW
jgi:hypothetical protein